MKTAISIPDQTFDAAEQLVKRLGISRSELYSKAISSYIKEHRNDSVTEALNEIYADEDKMDLMLNSWKFQFQTA
jgi:metal-responsive CopG/Arc/MetJ family transcriptional regulator